MSPQVSVRCTAFDGFRCIAAGGLAEVARKAKEAVDRMGPTPVLLFDDETGQLVDVDFRGTPEDVQRRLVDAREEAEAADLALEN